MSDLTIESAARWLPSDIDELRRESDEEGIGIVSTVIDRWADGTQRYDRLGEALLVAHRDGRVLAIGGLAWCPNVSGALRVRRFYVSPTARRQGIARELARRLIEDAAKHASVLSCNARASAGARPFWESLGFHPVDDEGITHRLDLATSTSTLETKLSAARERYVAANPTSASWASRAGRVLPGGNTRSVLHFDPFPFRVASASGRHVVDVDGHRYVDLLGNYTAGLLGHSPEPVRAAAHAAIDGGWALGAVHPNEVHLAELITDRFPSIEQVRFTNSGTEANLMALAVATNHTGRRKVLVFEGGYHGGVITFGGPVRPGGDVNVPHDWIVSRYNDLTAIDDVFAEHSDSIAAVLVEPLQGSAGCIPGTAAFLAALRRHCDDAAAVLIFDEVMTSRLSPGGAQQAIGITPDLTTLGKYLAGGFTFGAFGGRRDLMAAFDHSAGGRLGHAGTFNNNVVSMAAGVATLSDVLTPAVLAATNARGERLRSGLNNAFARHRVPMCVTGAGSLMNVHGTPAPVNSIDDLRTADDRWKELLFFDALDAGFYIARRGFIALSIEVTDADVDEFLAFVESWAAANTTGI